VTAWPSSLSTYFEFKSVSVCALNFNTSSFLISSCTIEADLENWFYKLDVLIVKLLVPDRLDVDFALARAL